MTHIRNLIEFMKDKLTLKNNGFIKNILELISGDAYEIPCTS